MHKKKTHRKFARRSVGRRWLIWLGIGLPLLLSVLLAGIGMIVNRMVEPSDHAGIPRRTIETTLSDGTRVNLSYLVAGDDSLPRVIYVHGTPGNATNFVRYLQNPIEGLEAVTIDRPGFGKSNAPRPILTYADQGRSIVPLLEQRAARKPILVGHSLGGPIIAQVAADFSQRVGALVILAGSLDPQLEEPRWFNHALQTPFVSAFFAEAVTFSNQEVLSARDHARSLQRVLDQVTCPIVIVHGRQDELVPFANVDYMKQHFRNARLHIMELDEAGHFLPWTHEKVVRSAIEKARSMMEKP